MTSTAITDIASGIVSMLTVVLPVGLGIFGLYVAVGAGKKMLKMFPRG